MGKKTIIQEIQEEIRAALPACCRDCHNVDGLGVCAVGGCGQEKELIINN